MSFRDALEADMVANHFNPDEFGEWFTFTTSAGAASQVLGVYDETPMTESTGAEVGSIAHHPRLLCRVSDLPAGSPAKGDRVTLAANVWHKAGTFRVVDFGNDKLGVIELYLQGSGT